MKLFIDPGHGGEDPGATFDGLREKDVTLSIARELAALLYPSSIETRLSRTEDVFVPLADRARAANSWNADLFLSIHTNADPDPDGPGMPEASGAEVYYLTSRGRLFAEHLGTGLRREFPGEPWRGARERGLYVIRKTAMPAALAEVAFIDDSSTARKLRAQIVRRQIAFALLRGVLGYQQEA